MSEREWPSTVSASSLLPNRVMTGLLKLVDDLEVQQQRLKEAITRQTEVESLTGEDKAVQDLWMTCADVVDGIDHWIHRAEVVMQIGIDWTQR